MTHLSEELQQRMVAHYRATPTGLIEFLAAGSEQGPRIYPWLDEFRAIAALLPDPDLEAAQTIVAQYADDDRWNGTPHQLAQLVLAGIRHARTQAKE